MLIKIISVGHTLSASNNTSIYTLLTASLSVYCVQGAYNLSVQGWNEAKAAKQHFPMTQFIKCFFVSFQKRLPSSSSCSNAKINELGGGDNLSLLVKS